MTSIDDKGLPLKAQLRLRTDGAWEVVVPLDATTKEAAEAIKGHVEQSLRQMGQRQDNHAPRFEPGAGRDAVLRACVDNMEIRKSSHANSPLYLVLAAIRFKVVRWEASVTSGRFQWKGGTDLVAMFPGRLSKGEISKAYTVLHAELSDLFDQSVSLEDANYRITEWSRHNSMEEVYGRLKATRD